MMWFLNVRLFSLHIGRFNFSPGLFMTVLTFAIVYTMYSLGLWQLSRAKYKDNLQQKIVERQNKPAVNYNQIPYEEDERLYLPIKIRGKYDSKHIVLLDNRIVEGVVGYDVYTPFTMSNGTAVLVNRGFIPQGKSRQDLPHIATPEVDIDIQGILEKPPSKGVILAENLHTSISWPMVMQYIDIEEIETKLSIDLMDMIVRLDSNEAGGLIYNQPVVNLNSSKNYGYAFQWFAMMTAVFSLFLVMNTKKRTKADESTSK